jgi:hypothetical protein
MAKRDVNWTNQDGLVVGFGTREVESTYSAKASTAGAEQQIVMRIKGVDLADAVVADQLVHAPVIPAGAFIKSAFLQVDTAFAGATAVLDIGLYKLSDGTAVDDDGIDSAIAVATLATDYSVACDGAEVGKQQAVACKVAASYDTAAFTDGVATLTVVYVNPLP